MKKLILLLCIFLINFNIFAQSEDADRVIPLLDKLKSNQKEDTNKVKIFSELAFEFAFNNPNEGIKYAQSGIELAKKLDFDFGLSTCLNNLGNCYYGMSDFDKSKDCFEKALIINEKINDKKGISISYTNLGNVYFSQSFYHKSLEYFFKSLKIDEELNIKFDIANDLGNIGNVYLFQQDYSTANTYFQKVLSIALELKSNSLIANTYGNIGNIYFEKASYDSSLIFFMKSLDYAKKSDYEFSIANTYGNIGMIYLKTNQYEKSYYNLNQALLLQKKLNNSLGIMINIGNTGTLLYNISKDEKFIRENNYKPLKLKNKTEYLNQSIRLLDSAIKIGEELQATKELIEWYESISKSYQELNNWKNAFYFINKSKNLHDSIFSQDNKNRIARLESIRENELLVKQTEYQKLLSTYYISLIVLLIVIAFIIFQFWRKKNKDNKVLNEKNNQIEDANLELEQLNEDLMNREQQLKELNATKDKFFSIIAHDIKNPLTALITGSELLFTYYDRFDDNDRLKNIGKLSESSRFLLKLLDNLLQWARSQTDSINFYPVLNSLSDVINDNLELLKLNLNDKNIEVSFVNGIDEMFIFDRNMISTVVRNLLSNAVKFTPNGGKIEITTGLTTVNNQYFFTIKDNGVGIPKENIENLFKIDQSISTSGTNNEKGTGLGLIICNEFVSKHSGEIKITSEIDKGSTFEIILPKINGSF